MNSGCESSMKRSKKSNEILCADCHTVNPLLFGRNFLQKMESYIVGVVDISYTTPTMTTSC
jgi:hypothetical protein